MSDDPVTQAEFNEAIYHRVGTQVERGYRFGMACRLVGKRIGMPREEVRNRYWAHVEAWLHDQERGTAA